MTTTTLRTRAPGLPSAAQHAAAAAAEARARRLLDPLPPYALRWTRGGPVRGETEFTAPIVVRLNDALAPAEVYEVVLHELRHVADHALIGHLPIEELEHRAALFAARVMKETPMSMPTTTGHTTGHTTGGHTSAGHRQALIAEGHAIALQAERARRRFTPAERARAAEILAGLGPAPVRSATPGPLPSPRCVCGTPLTQIGSTSYAKCTRCGRMRSIA